MSRPSTRPTVSIRAPKTAERVAASIVQAIISEELPAGTMLPAEAAMLESYGVSRASLREGLRILEVNGLIWMRPGSRGGPVVGAVDATNFGRTVSLFLQLNRTTFTELMDARMTMEPLMARLAAERKDPERLEQLEALLEAHRELGPADAKEYIRTAQDFHAVVAGLSGNPVLDLFGRSLTEIYTKRILVWHEPTARWPEVKREHEEIATAILNGDAQTAELLMAAHMRAFVASVSDRYSGIMDEIVSWSQ